MTRPNSPAAAIYVLPLSSWPYLAIGAAIVLGSGWFSSATPRVVLLEGIYVGALLLSLAGCGAFPARFFRRTDTSPRQFLIATALGWGIVAPLLLVLGVLGLLNRPVAWCVVGAGLLLGFLRLATSARHVQATPPEASITPAGLLTRFFLMLPLVVFGAVLLYGVTLPPGLLWDAEGNGYDVLEYHLQVQREYYDARRIHFLPHNVYASFPQQVEILYLWLMHLRGGPYEAAIAAQLLHAALGVLALMVLAAWSPPGWGRLTALLLAGSVPWLAYTGCLAYVELGLLYFAALAAALLVEQLDRPQDATERESAAAVVQSSALRPGSAEERKAELCTTVTRKAELCTTALAGLCAGWAGATKYTGLVLVAAALAAAWFLCRRGGLRNRVRDFALFALAAAVAVSPWLIRNTAFTGNPVYPFAYSVFGGVAWSESQARQWKRGHALPAEQSHPPARLAIAARETVRSELFGPALWILPLIGALLRRDRITAMLALWAVLMLAAWLTLTHLPGRFLISLIVPLTLLASRGAWSQHAGKAARTTLPVHGRGAVITLLSFLGAIWTGRSLLRILKAEEASWRKLTNTAMADMVDRTDLMLEAQPLNHMTNSAGANLWLVGPAAVFYVTVPHHYTVVFNRDAWLEQPGHTPAGESRAATGRSAPAGEPRAGTNARSVVENVRWLRENGISHVVFDWAEIERLRNTYGFPQLVRREWVVQLIEAGLRPSQIRDNSMQSARLQSLEVPQ